MGTDYWLSTLGLGYVTDVSTDPRRGFYTFTDYRGPAQYAHRIISGHRGRQIKQIIRHKTLFLEEIFAAFTSCTVQADMINTDLIGGNVFVQTSQSKISELSEAQYMMGNLQAVLKCFSNVNFVNFSNSPSASTFVLAVGATQVPNQECLTMSIPNYFNEMRASLQPVTNNYYSKGPKSKNKKSGWSFCTYPLLVSGGITCVNPYENYSGGDPTDLNSIIETMYPNSVGNVYNFAPDSSGLSDYFDPLDLTNSWVSGSQIVPAIQITSTVYNQLQGNLTMSTPQANFHTENTLMYYTRLISDISTSEEGYSQYHLAIILDILNRLPFRANDITYDLMKILPTTQTDRRTYQPIYKECSSVHYSSNQPIIANIVNTMLAYPHPIAGEGTESGISDVSMIAQHLGGGFMPFLKILGKSFLPAPLGDIAGELLNGLG